MSVNQGCFVLIATFLVRYQPAELHALLDYDVSEAAAALAGTFETALRGVIYDHRPASLPAERLLGALRPVLAEAGRAGGTAFERDTAVVLRRVVEAVSEARVPDPENQRAFLDLLGRAISKTPGSELPQRDPGESGTTRLILP